MRGARSPGWLGRPLEARGVDEVNLYHDFASSLRDVRPGLDSCLRALRKGDVFVV